MKYPLFAILILFLLSSCSSISQKDAEQAATDFINKNVVFFAKGDNSTTNLPAYTINSISSYKEKGNWIIVMHVSASLDKEVKQNDLSFKVDKKGKIIEFNGKNLPMS